MIASGGVGELRHLVEGVARGRRRRRARRLDLPLRHSTRSPRRRRRCARPGSRSAELGPAEPDPRWRLSARTRGRDGRALAGDADPVSAARCDAISLAWPPLVSPSRCVSGLPCAACCWRWRLACAPRSWRLRFSRCAACWRWRSAWRRCASRRCSAAVSCSKARTPDVPGQVHAVRRRRSPGCTRRARTRTPSCPVLTLKPMVPTFGPRHGDVDDLAEHASRRRGSRPPVSFCQRTSPVFASRA